MNKLPKDKITALMRKYNLPEEARADISALHMHGYLMGLKHKQNGK